MALKIVNVYFLLIKAGSRTIDQVPFNLKDDVQALIDADNAAMQQALQEQPAQ